MELRSETVVRGKRAQMVEAVSLVVLVSLTLVVSGCKPEPVRWSELGTELNDRGYREIEIEAQSNQEVADLTPDDIIMVMSKIGFTPEQTLEYGPLMYRALGQAGAARVYVGKKVEAVLRVKGRLVFIRSSSRGSFIYDLEKSRFGLM